MKIIKIIFCSLLCCNIASVSAVVREVDKSAAPENTILKATGRNLSGSTACFQLLNQDTGTVSCVDLEIAVNSSGTKARITLPSVTADVKGNLVITSEGGAQVQEFFTLVLNADSPSLLVDETSGPQGPAGPQGPQGLGGAGPQGPAGPVGATGPVGPAGADGTSGGIGPIGPVGPIGATGPEGPVGATGATGPQGPSGSPGTPGMMGPPGMMGMTGPMGPVGPTGETGPIGPMGPMGPAGGSSGGLITGTVNSCSGLEGSSFTIHLANQLSSVSLSSTSRAFQFSNVPAGTYTLIVKQFGTQAGSQTGVVVTDGNTTNAGDIAVSDCDELP